mgnify:CR=1 FL=1
MKTEIDRICGIMYTLLEHQPVIDVPYEKINDIAVALVKEGYGKVSEYEAEREMLGSQIKVLEQRLNDKYIEVDNLNRDYRNAFERLKSQGREITKLKEENKKDFDNFVKVNDELLKANMKLSVDKKQAQTDTINAIDKEIRAQRKQTRIDVLNELKKKTHNYYPSIDSYCMSQHVVLVRDIDELIKEIENGQ